jgi:hypothetical protein
MAVPRKKIKKTGLSISRFIDCMAVRNSLSGTFARPLITETVHAKNNPATIPTKKVFMIIILIPGDLFEIFK